jgi:hypothetical protein
MDDILSRVGNLETTLAHVRADVASLKATMPHLATKSEVGELKALISSVEASVIRWVVGTAIGTAAVAFAAAKLVA